MNINYCDIEKEFHRIEQIYNSNNHNPNDRVSVNLDTIYFILKEIISKREKTGHC